MLSDQLALVKTRKNFYRDYYRKACAALFFALVLILVLCAFLVYLFFQEPAPDFYATSMNGSLTQLKPLSTPNYSNKPLID